MVRMRDGRPVQPVTLYVPLADHRRIKDHARRTGQSEHDVYFGLLASPLNELVRPGSAGGDQPPEPTLPPP